MKLDPKKTVFLIDGSSFLYRSYYGLRPLHTAKGVPAALAGLLLEKRFVRRMTRKQLLVRECGHVAAALGCRFVGFHT